MKEHLSSVRKHIPWGPFDQLLSALTNALVVVIAARSLDADQVGLLAVVLSLAMLTVSFGRALVCQPMGIIDAHGSPRDRQLLSYLSLVNSLAIGVGAGTILIAIGAIIGGELGHLIVILGAGSPILLIQDCLRYAFFTHGPAWGALISDTVWLLALAGGMGVLGATSDSQLLLGWICGASAGFILTLPLIGRAPYWGEFSGRFGLWLSSRISLIPGLTLDALMIRSLGYAVPIVVAAMAGLEGAGDYKVAQTVVGPILVVIVGSGAQYLPDLSRRLASNSNVGRFLVRYAVALFAVGLGGTLAIALAPAQLMQSLFDELWDGARPIAIFLGLSAALTGLAHGPLLYLRAAQKVDRIASRRALLFPLQLTAVLVGSATFGGVGAAVGLACGNAVATLVWWSASDLGVREALRSRRLLRTAR